MSELYITHISRSRLYYFLSYVPLMLEIALLLEPPKSVTNMNVINTAYFNVKTFLKG